MRCLSAKLLVSIVAGVFLISLMQLDSVRTGGDHGNSLRRVISLVQGLHAASMDEQVDFTKVFGNAVSALQDTAWLHHIITKTKDDGSEARHLVVKIQIPYLLHGRMIIQDIVFCNSIPDISHISFYTSRPVCPEIPPPIHC